jgi:hypothetical protein
MMAVPAPDAVAVPRQDETLRSVGTTVPVDPEHRPLYLALLEEECCTLVNNQHILRETLAAPVYAAHYNILLVPPSALLVVLVVAVGK